MGKLTKKEARERIEEFFQNLKDKSPKDLKKMKKLAMHYNIKLKDKRKKFCKKCFSSKLKVKSLKNKIKRVECQDCGNISRWKVKPPKP